MTRDRSLGKGPSAHDSTGAPGRGDKQRPLTGGWIKPPTKPRRQGPTGFGRSAAVVITVLVLAVIAAGVYVAVVEKRPAPVPSNQPSTSADPR